MLSERERQEMRRIAKKHRSKGGSLNAASFPNKGQLDFAGNVFSGLPRQKIADGAIGTNEIADNQVTSEKVASLDGGKLHRNSVPADAIHSVHGSKIVGEESVPWENVRVSGVVFTERLDATVRDLKRFMAKNYQKR